MLVTRDECCGCEACVNICEKKAIRMQHDREGFFYPTIDEKACIMCGMCDRVCPVKGKENTEKYLSVWAAQNQDVEKRIASSSGGIVFAICRYVLEQNGVVYGAAFDDDFTVEHIRCSDLQSLERIMGSKYVQSRMGEIYQEIEKDLRQNRVVCFVGSPCQNEAVRKYLFTKRLINDKALFVDFICHGVPSPMVWKDYLDDLQRKAGKKIEKIKFRDKKYGWQKPNILIQFEDSHIAELLGENSYYNCFLRNIVLRPSCYQCKFTSECRNTDITVGDFWGAEEHFAKKMDIKSGVSLILVNSERGLRLFENIRKYCWIEKIDSGMFYQPNLHMPTAKPENRDAFWKEYEKMDCKGEVINKWGYINKTLYRGKLLLVSFVKKIKLYRFCVKIVTRMKR